MPTIIDALVITLGFDTRGLAQGRAKQSEELGKIKADVKQTEAEILDIRRRSTAETKEQDAQRIESLKGVLDQKKKAAEEQEAQDKVEIEAQKRKREAYDSVRRSVVAATATIIGANGIKQYIESTVTGFSQMGRAAKAAGLDVAQLAAFGNTIARNGGDAGAARGALSSLSAQLEQFRTLGQASPQLIGALQQIGGNANDSALTIFDKFSKYAEGKDPRLVAQTGNMLGFDEATVNEAMKGQTAVRADMAESQRLAKIDQARVDKLTALQRAALGLRQTVTGDANDMLTGAAPTLTSVINLTAQIADKFPALTKAILLLAVAWTAVSGLKLGGSLLGLGGGAGAAAAGGAAAEVATDATGAAVGLGAGGGALALGAGGVAFLGAMAYATPAGAGEDALMRRNYAKFMAAKAQARGRSGDQIGAAAGGGSRADQYRAYLIAHGVNPETARGIIAGMTAENGKLDPTARNPGSTAYGLLQLTKSSGRQDDFRAFAGRDLHGSSWQQQLDFMLYEMRHKEAGAGRSIMGANADTAMTNYVLRYMRPKVGAETIGDLRRGHRALAGTSIHIDTVNVQTQATDARGIARSIKGDLQQVAAQSNSGLN